MVLLTGSSPLTWEETKELSQHVREHGIKQFINIYRKLKDRQGDVLKWGDELEYMVIKFDNRKKIARVCLRAEELLKILNKKEIENPNGVKSLWRPEHGAYMIESTPGQPYGSSLAQLNLIQPNMRYRRKEISELLKPDESLLSIACFPRLGTPAFTWPIFYPTPEKKHGSTCSRYIPDEALFSGHPRFHTLSRNIRQRRGEKVNVNLPIFKDQNTGLPVEGSLPAKPDTIHLDAMVFGMGCCCLQVTFQACNLAEARILYDQLTPLCPIMLALTAASPVFRGYLTDTDCRWNALSGSADCRTAEERGERPLKMGQMRIHKSRCDSVNSYISTAGQKYNDLPLTIDKKTYRMLRAGGVDHLMAQHIAYLFVRDTVSLYQELIDQNDDEDCDHFDNIQSTNWQTMRFKPPPLDSSTGWRVEFRPCEAQLTEFESSAFVCFIVLVTRVILSYNLNFLIPLSKVDENMQTAQKQGSWRNEKFWFRKHVSDDHLNQNGHTANKHSAEEYQLMSINEIINGHESFPGLIPLINSYLNAMDVDTTTHCTIQRYLHFIQRRASGELITMATWIRQEVVNHPDYKKDSVVGERITYDILKKAEEIQEGKRKCSELFG